MSQDEEHYRIMVLRLNVSASHRDYSRLCDPSKARHHHLVHSKHPHFSIEKFIFNRSPSFIEKPVSLKDPHRAGTDCSMPYNTKGIAYVSCQWTLTLLALVIVPLRVYSRSFLTRSFGSDDFFIIIPLVGAALTNTLSRTAKRRA